MKCYYPFTYKQAIKCAAYLLVFLLLCIGALLSPRSVRVYFQFIGYAFLIGVFVHKYFTFLKKKKEGIYISLYATKCLKMFEALILCITVMVCIGVLMVLENRRVWVEDMLMWQFAFLILVYFAALFCSFIVIFGEKTYVSGFFGISYDEIEEVIEVKTNDIMGTKITQCEIITKNGKRCMEKVVVDEYEFLCSLRR